MSYKRNRVTLIGLTGSRDNRKRKPTFCWGSHEVSFWRHFFSACSSLFQPAVIALPWLSAVQTVMISLPPLPDKPLSVGGRADLTAVSSGPSSIADKRVCLSMPCTRLCMHVCPRAHVCVRWKYYAYIKAHDMGTPAGLSDDASLASHFCRNVFITNDASRLEMLENVLFVNGTSFKTAP